MTEGGATRSRNRSTFESFSFEVLRDVHIVCFPEDSSIRAESNKGWEMSQTGKGNHHSCWLSLDGITESAENAPGLVSRVYTLCW